MPITKSYFNSVISMFKLLTIIFLFSFSQPIFAESLNIVLNGKSFHAKKKNYNEDSWGLGIEYNFKEDKKWVNFINGGFFKDSNSNRSNYFGGGIKRRFLLTDDKDNWHMDAGVTAFVMTRKGFKNSDPFIGALPYLSIGTRKFSVNATYIPSISPKFVAVVFLQASFTLHEW